MLLAVESGHSTPGSTQMLKIAVWTQNNKLLLKAAICRSQIGGW